MCGDVERGEGPSAKQGDQRSEWLSLQRAQSTLHPNKREQLHVAATRTTTPARLIWDPLQLTVTIAAS